MQEVKLSQDSIDRIADAIAARLLRSSPPADTTASLDVRTAANMLGLSTATIRRMIRRGELHAYKVAGHIRIKRAELEAALAPIEAAADAPQAAPAAREDRPSSRERARRSRAGSVEQLDAIEREARGQD